MSFIKYSDELEEKINSFGVVILKKEIKIKSGFYELGSRCSIELKSYDKDEDTCILTLYNYGNGSGFEHHDIKIRVDEIDDYFMPDTKLKELESIYSEIIKKQRKITDVLEIVLTMNFLLLMAASVSYVIMKITGEPGLSSALLFLKISAVLFIPALIMWILFDRCYLLKQRKEAGTNIDNYLHSDIDPKDIQSG